MTIYNGLADAAGVSELTGLSVKTVQSYHYDSQRKSDQGHQLTERDMPLPVARFGRASVWSEAEVRAWDKARQRLDGAA